MADGAGSTARGSAAVEEALDRIERYDPAIGAFTSVLADRARQESRAGPAAGGPRGVLAGVPVAVKELFEVAGGAYTCGSRVRAGRVGCTDAAVVRALRRAGAVIVGTARTHEFGWGITTQGENGSTVNPWDPTLVAGGSSGGSAAAVATGMVPLAVGSDTGGSIRIPAAYCGVLGLKTTFGRVSRSGSVPLVPSFDTPGFLARRVAVLAAALGATAGDDPDDPATAAGPPVTPDPSARPSDPVAGLTFAVADALAVCPTSEARQRAVQGMVDALVAGGARQVEVEVPPGRDLYQAYAIHQMAEAYVVHADLLGTFPGQAAAYGADVRERLTRAQGVTMADYLEVRQATVGFAACFERAFRDVDVLLSPVGSGAPPTVADPDQVPCGDRRLPLREAVMPTTAGQSLAGLPSITMPIGLDEAGLPIGLQVTGPRWSEGKLLALAGALEEAGVLEVPVPPGYPAG